MNPDTLKIWVVFRNPTDFPGKFVLRVQEILPGGHVYMRPEVWLRDSLEALRECVPPGLYRQDRQREDPEQIVEVWF